MESVLAPALRRAPILSLEDLRRLKRPTRRTVLGALLAMAPLTGGYLLFRDSSFVAVKQVEISGVRGVESAAVSQALESTAKRMSTLDYSVSELEAAVSRYPVVRSLRVTTSFPHQMRIVVEEQPPVAQISAAGVRAAVAADGIVLGPSLISPSLPYIPASVVPSPGRRVGGGTLLAYLAVLGAAPSPLLSLVARIYTGGEGITVQMRNGLLAYFGDASRPHAKWDALITVLSDPSSSGAGYVDLRLPERPAAGVPQGGVGSGEALGVSASDPTSAALAASLAQAVNGEPIAPLTSTSTTTSEPAATASEPPATASEPPAAGEPPAAAEPSTSAAQEAPQGATPQATAPSAASATGASEAPAPGPGGG